MKQEFPPGWNEERIKKVIAYYENQTEDEQVAEHEAALAEQTHTMMIVPAELVPEVRRLIAKKRPGLASRRVAQARKGGGH
jgi:hypothetical protein